MKKYEGWCWWCVAIALLLPTGCVGGFAYLMKKATKEREACEALGGHMTYRDGCIKRDAFIRLERLTK